MHSLPGSTVVQKVSPPPPKGVVHLHPHPLCIGCGSGCRAVIHREVKVVDWEIEARKARQERDSVLMALVVCAAALGWVVGGWAGFGLFLLFAGYGSAVSG